MKGTVKHINATRGMVAVLTEEGEYSVFELLGTDIVELGDLVSWPHAMALGSEWITNYTQGKQHEVYFQNHSVHSSQLSRQLLYP